MRQVIILSGISGCGKSAYAERLLNKSQGVKVSADHYFTQPDGSYHFDATKLSEAHADCFNRFLGFLVEGLSSQVVVDNTNLTAWEISPYMLGAQAFGWEAEVRTIRCRTLLDVQTCAERNIHGLTLDAIRAQHRRLSERRLPPFWKNTNYYLGEM